MKTASVLLLTMLALAACDRAPPVSAPAAATVVKPPLTATGWPVPAPVGAAQPDLVATSDGQLLLSWIQPQDDGHTLQFARFDGRAWSAPRAIASGDDWFVNWADTPHIAITGDGALWAHWLQKSASATYAYDVALVRSGDHGATWSKPILVNDDGKAAEHGFVSLWPASPDSIGIAWLDGRHSGGGGHDGHLSTGSGQIPAMTLRAARFDAKLQRSAESEVDAMTCDCCQTDVALTARGPLLVYRDRTANEIRDIAVTRAQGDAWTSPQLVHADRWKMPACPVNGPAVAARGNDAVIAWYTAPGDMPMLRVARSIDAGDTFSPPLTVDQGAEVQGRVDVALDAHAAWVTWVREEAVGQSLQLARYAPNPSIEPERLQVTAIAGRGRATGFPQLALTDDAAYVVWTEVVDGKPRLRGARIALQ